MMVDKSAADFFAGIGLVSYALKLKDWNMQYALDYNQRKELIYLKNFGGDHYHCKNIEEVSGSDIPQVTLAHASFPCTNTSVAGSRDGILKGESSAFWEFVRILSELKESSKNLLPPLVMLENVAGLLTSGKGGDILKILFALNELGYAVDVLLIDASRFVPQSRVRLFIIGNLLSETEPQTNILQYQLDNSSDARPKRVKELIINNPKIKWYLHDLPDLPTRSFNLDEIIDRNTSWWEPERTEYLYSQMFDRHKAIVDKMMLEDVWSYGTVFRRMRVRDGKRQSTAELRTDGVAGCLRTPKGGSAKQILVRAGKQQFNARLLNEFECARLMGAGDFLIPKGISFNEALFGFGDAVAVPVVEWIIENYLNHLVVKLNKLKEPELIELY